MTRQIFILLFLTLTLSQAANARLIETIPSHYVKLTVDGGGAAAPGQLGRTLVYLDGPALLWRGSWIDPDELENVPSPRSAVPELLVPVRVVIPGAYKFIDLESKDSVLGEIEAESYTPNARIYRILLPISSMLQNHRFEVVFHAGLKAPLVITSSFEPPEGLVVRNKECVHQGVALDAAVETFQEGVEPNIIYLFCQTDGNSIQTGVYAPVDRTWSKFGYGARKVFADRGLYFRLPRPERGVMVPETITEFELNSSHGKKLKYELRYDPPYRPRIFSMGLGLGPSYHHYSETARGFTIDELGFYGKLALQFKVLPAGLDFYTDIAGTIQDVVHTPSTQPPNNAPLAALQYWAINTRLGYVEPVTPLESEWSFMLGWYWWRFYVVKENYGLANKLSGPQFFVQYKHQRLRQAPWWLNARWVFLADRGLPGSANDREFSLGGGFDIAWVGKRRPLSLNLDLSQLQFYQGNRNMTLTNLILTLSYAIF